MAKGARTETGLYLGWLDLGRNVLASIGNHVSVVSSKSIKCTRDCKYRAGLPLIFVDDLVDLVDYKNRTKC